jgi:soluble lytic murein transglycosylase-like protein
VKILIAPIITLIITSPFLCHAFCFNEAGKEFGVSPALLWAIAKVESGFDPTAMHENTNGSFDYGVMQINSGWYNTLGYDRWKKLNDACFNVRCGAWILGQCVKKHGYSWEAVGCYNAVSPIKRAQYANKIYRELVKAGATRNH